MTHYSTKLVSLFTIAGIIVATMMSVTHVHLGHGQEQAELEALAVAVCSCGHSHAPKTLPSEQDSTPVNDDDCNVCKLLADFQFTPVVGVDLSLELNVSIFELAEVRNIVAQPFRSYLGRAPPIS